MKLSKNSNDAKIQLKINPLNHYADFQYQVHKDSFISFVIATSWAASSNLNIMIMRSLKISIIFLAIQFLASCKIHNNTKNAELTFNIDLNKSSNSKPHELFSNISFYPLQTDSNCIISNPDKAIYYKKELYILDKRQRIIFVFDSIGTFKRKLDKKGRGPGEYNFISDFTINPYNNNIEFINGYNLYTYNNKGEFIKKTRIADSKIRAVNAIEVINPDLIAFLYVKNPNNLIYSRSNKQFIYKSNVFPTWINNKLPFFEGRLFRTNNTAYYHESFCANIYKITKDGYLFKYKIDLGEYSLNLNNPTIKSDLSSSKRKISLEVRNMIMDKYAIMLQHFVENNKYIFMIFYVRSKIYYLLINKLSNKYLIRYSTEGLSNILGVNKPSVIQFNDKNEIIALGENVFLKRTPSVWLNSLSYENKRIIENLSLYDNPVLIKLQFNNSRLKELD